MNLLNILKGAVTLIVVIIGSWILVHVVAIFGIFLVIAIPLLHVFFASSFPCLWCRISNNPAAHRFSHAFIDSLLLLVLTIASIGVVYGEASILQYFGFPVSEKTVSFVIPSQKQYKLGEIFPVQISISGVQQAVNTVQADLSFDPKRLEVVSVTTDGSFATIFLQKSYSNDLGYVRLTGGVPNPGYTGSAGTFGTVYFKGKIPGIASVTFLPTSLVLANDGHGTNILKDFATANYLIIDSKLSVHELQMQNEIATSSAVLGAETPANAPMTFYQYAPPAEPQVLGAEKSPVTPGPSPAPSPLLRPLSILSSIDSRITKFWDTVTTAFKQLFS